MHAKIELRLVNEAWREVGTRPGLETILDLPGYELDRYVLEELEELRLQKPVEGL